MSALRELLILSAVVTRVLLCESRGPSECYVERGQGVVGRRDECRSGKLARCMRQVPRTGPTGYRTAPPQVGCEARPRRHLGPDPGRTLDACDDFRAARPERG